MANIIRAACEQSAKYIASKENCGWRIRTKNKIKQISDPTNSNNPKKSPFDAPTQSTRPEAWASTTARRDSITSSLCSKSSSLAYLKSFIVSVI